MKDEIIQFETAKLAKEKGFDLDELIIVYYGLDSKKLETNRGYTRLDDSCEAYAPTQSLLQRWLREVHGLNISIALSGTRETTWFWSINDKKYQEGSVDAYEEALEVGLLEALKMIK